MNEKQQQFYDRGQRQAEEGISLGAVYEIPAGFRAPYLRGYLAGRPATPCWAALKADNLALLERSWTWQTVLAVELRRASKEAIQVLEGADVR